VFGAFNKSRRIKDMNNLKLLTPSEVAKILGLSVETLNVWRATKRYPLPYVKSGRLVRYRISDVENFINSRLRNFSSTANNQLLSIKH
jgi:excisionase family DNA binding protein